MFLKALSIKGFKSFADPAVLELEPGITVVVGPNGSGKSNVVDAVAWVLGAQGPRAVRSAKMEDVIFAGTASRPALGRAEVSLTIDNSSGKLPTDLAEITITRTLFRSGESEYAINGAPCRLLDVQELLSDTGVGRQQHVIISQGQLDAILNARPEDRRAVIEEAAGVLKFRRRRERSERRLAATEENLERLYDLVREVKRQIRPLERQAAAASSHASLADELRLLRVHLAGLDLARLEERCSEGTKAAVALRATEGSLRASLAELDDATSRTTDALSAQREADMASALGRVEGMVERSRGLAGVLRERRRGLERAIDAAADVDVVSTLEAEGARLADELEAASSAIEEGEPERQRLAQAEQVLAAELEAARKGAGGSETMRAAEEAVTVARTQVVSLRAGLERDRRALDQVAVRQASLARRIEACVKEEGESSERLAGTERARAALQQAVAATEAAHRAAVGRLEGAEETLRQAEQEHHRSVARVDALSRVLDEARGAAGAELLAGVDGVVGTLLDLIEVDAGWEDAFEAAAGASLAAVVVSGDDAARAALATLRKGEASGAVLALTRRLPPRRPDPVRVAPVGAGEPVRRHVRPRMDRTSPEGLDALLDRVLQDALCCDGGWSAAIDLALARPELVVVTREGDRFSATGWRVRAAGGVVTAALVEEARERAERAGAEAAAAAEERAAARRQVEETRAAAAEASRRDDRNESAHGAARGALQRIADERAGLAAELEDVERERDELESRVAGDRAAVASLEAELPELEARRQQLAEIEERAERTRTEIERRLAEAARARKELDVRLAAAAERRRVLADRLMEVERRLEGHAGERLQAAERRRRLEADARAVDRLAAVVADAHGRLTALLEELRARHRAEVEAARAGGARLESLRRERAAAEHELAAVRSRLQRLELDLAEATIRRDGIVEVLERELGCSPEEARLAPPPDLAPGVEPAARMAEIEARIAALGPVNPLAVEELSELSERHHFLETQVDDVRRARRELQHGIRTLDEEIMSVFDAAFADVNEHFSTLVSSLFPGGTGRLSLTDPEHLLDTGIEVEVRPAGRNVRRLSLLSGGERSLVALAFLFAVFRSRPSPFYLMDEVEAALDDVNLHRFLGLVQEFRAEAQLIIVSHQKRTMEAGDALYGVTMAPGGSSKVVSQKVRHPSATEEGREREDGAATVPVDGAGPVAPAERLGSSR